MTPPAVQSPLLDAGVVHPTEDVRGVGWPVWRFPVEVEIDAVLGGELDLFELAVLQLVDLGVVSVADLAEDLGLVPALVRLVRERLRTKGMLLGGELTADARRALAEDAAREPLTVSGWVMVDAITGRLWPRFAQVLWPVVQRRVGKRLELVNRNGNVHRDGAFPLQPGVATRPHAPSVGALRDTLRIASFADAGPDPVTFSLRSAPSIVGDPSLVHVLTYAFVEGGVRRMLEPCGPGEAPDLEEALDEMPDAPKFLRRLQKDGDDELGLQARRIANLRHERKWLRLLVDERGLDPAHESTRLLVQARALLDDGKQSVALVELHRALETVLRAACPKPRRAELREPLHGDVDELREVIAGAADNCGFAAEAPRAIAKSVLEQWKDGYPRACAGLLVLDAAGNPEHPLRRLARADAAEEHQRDPTVTRSAWLVDVNDFGYVRNPRSHGPEPGDAAPAVVGEDRIGRLFRLVEITAQHLMRST